MVNKSDKNKIIIAQWSLNNSLIVIVLDNNEIIVGTVEGE